MCPETETGLRESIPAKNIALKLMVLKGCSYYSNLIPLRTAMAAIPFSVAAFFWNVAGFRI